MATNQKITKAQIQAFSQSGKLPENFFNKQKINTINYLMFIYNRLIFNNLDTNKQDKQRKLKSLI